jgi:two-component system phosphate regulon response regulator PhoB
MSQVPHILVVDDEPAQRALLVYNLEASGFETSVAENGEEALRAISENPPDLVVLDWMMPRVSGIEACRRIKASSETSEIAVIILSAKSDETDKIRGLDIGADDYMSKPYSVNELIARIRALLRRTRPAAVGQTLEYQDISVNTQTHRVTRGGVDIQLGPTEFRLLCTLIEHPERVWSRDQLLDRVWGRDVYVDTRTVDVHVGRLRKLLNKNSDKSVIRTVRGAGYALG